MFDDKKFELQFPKRATIYQTSTIGQIIRSRRHAKHLTQEKMAELCDMSTRGLAKIELGGCEPKWFTLARIAYVLGLDLGDLSDCVADDHIGALIFI